MAMILTQVYLDAPQKKALSAQAKRAGRSVSDLMREAVDAAILGVTSEDIKMLDAGTIKAKADIDAMLVDLRQNAKEHKDFMREIKRLRRVAA
jgi:plasmid stability protein